MKIYGYCEGCKKNRFFVKRRNLVVPGLGNALSKKENCRKCINNMQMMIDGRVSAPAS